MASKKANLHDWIIKNAAEINRLHDRVHETFKRRAESEEAWREWLESCKELRTHYGPLCLPGGWDPNFFDRIVAGDPHAIEVALSFLEVRPYFFRSGYLWKDILRKCKRAPMCDEHAARFATLMKKHEEWQERKRRSK